MQNQLTSNYWNNRYLKDETGWDIGDISTPLKDFIDTLTDKNIRILIPGAGRAHEAVYLHKNGFKNVFVCDWAEEAFINLKIQTPDFPKENRLIGDFFKLDIEVDLILEQTFFCAINPDLRPEYAEKTASILAENGMLTGLFFGVEFERAGPPFGGIKEDYLPIFEPYFDILEMDFAENSIKPRFGKELFFRMTKKNS
ncbi:MAG: hypothetical protein ACI9XO_002346 [Paraglaciecola sp.]|jgi:hypothetical protein